MLKTTRTPGSKKPVTNLMDDKLKDELMNRELETLAIKLTAKSSRTIISLEEYIQSRTVQGATIEAIKESLLDDLENNGPIFGEFNRAIKATAHGNSMRMSDVGQFANQGIDIKYRWVAVLINTCPDCIDRHNTVMTWGDWEEEGIPRSGHTVCGEHCKCVLIPNSLTTDEQEPIQRGKQ